MSIGIWNLSKLHIILGEFEGIGHVVGTLCGALVQSSESGVKYSNF